MKTKFSKQNFVLSFVLMLILSACGGQEETELLPKTIHVPTYATYDGVMDAVREEAMVTAYEPYINNGKSKADLTIKPGLIGIFVKGNLPSISNKTIKNLGQTCRSDFAGNFLLKEYNLVVKIVNTSTDDPSFLEYCRNQFPKTIKAIMVEAVQGDGDFLIIYQEVDFNIKVK